MRFAVAVGFACGLLFNTSLSAQALRIENVTVISPERDTPLHKATVQIRNDRFVGAEAARHRNP